MMSISRMSYIVVTGPRSMATPAWLSAASSASRSAMRMYMSHAVRAVRLWLGRSFGERQHQLEAVAVDHGEARRLAPDPRLAKAEASVEIDRSLQIGDDQEGRGGEDFWARAHGEIDSSGSV